jgi:hypothetical protein
MRKDITPFEFVIALPFGALTIFVVALKPQVIMVMIIVGALELFALLQLRRPGIDVARAGGWLRAAAALTIVTAFFLLIPVVLSGHVKDCFECENETQEGYNFLGIFILMWLAAAIAGVGALISWGISLVRVLRRGDPISRV